MEVDYHTPSEKFSHKVLKESFYRKVDFPHPIKNIFEEPFFCSDFKHVFFVDLDKSLIPVRNYEYIGPEKGIVIPKEIPFDDIWINPDFKDPGFIDPVPWAVYVAGGQASELQVEEIAAKQVMNNPVPFNFEGANIGVHGLIV